MVGPLQCARPEGSFPLLRRGLGCVSVNLHRAFVTSDRDGDVLRDVSEYSCTSRAAMEMLIR